MDHKIGLPGKELTNRILHFFWICDASGSMGFDGKIQSLNTAIREAIPHMQDAAEANAHARVLVRAIKFSDGAQWHIANATDVADFTWIDLHADGVTDMGKALQLVAKELRVPPMADHALPPVLVLISDGQPTDDFVAGLEELERLPWGQRCVRIAIAIGKDADMDVMKRFVNNPEIPVLTASNPEQLVDRIRWASTVVVKAVSTPGSDPDEGDQPVTGNVNIPTDEVVEEDPKIAVDSVW